MVPSVGAANPHLVETGHVVMHDLPLPSPGEAWRRSLGDASRTACIKDRTFVGTWSRKSIAGTDWALSSRTSRSKKWMSHGFGRDLVPRQATFPLSSNGTYTGDPPPGLMSRGAFLGFQSLDRKVCGDVEAVVQVPALR